LDRKRRNLTIVERHFEKEISKVMETLKTMADAVQQAVDLSIRSFFERDAVLAQQVLDNEPAINTLEITIDNEVITFFALQQPVAVDLRLVLAIQIVNNELERIGDHAVNIAEAAMQNASHGSLAEELAELFEMSKTVTAMLHDAVACFFTEDSERARALLFRDDEVDGMNRGIILKSIMSTKKDPQLIDAAMECIRVSKNLERIADLSTNIAEEELFHSQARMVKHHTDTPVPPEHEGSGA
jgi:phosphate transport system protein